MSTTIEEPTFVKAFLSLLKSNASVQLSEDYVNDDLSARPLTLLPEMPKTKIKKARTDKSSNVATVKVNLKSIKAPKFSCSIECNGADTIYSVKEKATQTEEQIKGLNPTSLRFLVKGKVVSDSKTLEEYGEEVSFTVMIKKAEGSASPAATPEPEIQAPEPFVDLKQDDESTWNEVRSVLMNRLGDQNGVQVFSKMKARYYSN